MMLVLCDRLAETDPDFHGGPHLIVNPNGLGFLIAYGSSLCHRSARLCRRDVQSLVCKFGGKKPDPQTTDNQHSVLGLRRYNIFKNTHFSSEWFIFMVCSDPDWRPVRNPAIGHIAIPRPRYAERTG